MRSAEYCVLVTLAFAAGWIGSSWHSQSQHGRQLAAQDGEVSTNRRDRDFVELINRMGRAKELPFSIFGAGMPHGQRWRPALNNQRFREAIGTNAVFDKRRERMYWLTQRCLSRIAFIRFLGQAMATHSGQAKAAAHRQAVPVRCLEWDTPSFLAGYPACEEAWVFSYSAGHHGKSRRLERTLFGDVTEMASQFPSLIRSFHIIFCNQVFEHVRQPHRAAANLAAMLAPGGVGPSMLEHLTALNTESAFTLDRMDHFTLHASHRCSSSQCPSWSLHTPRFAQVLIFTVPFLEPLHAVPLDFHRFTLGGAIALFEDVGLRAERGSSAVGGNSHLTAAFLLGMGAGEVEQEELLANLVIPSSLKDQGRVADSDELEPLSRKLYMGSYVVFRAPLYAARLYMWERTVWTPPVYGGNGTIHHVHAP